MRVAWRADDDEARTWLVTQDGRSQLGQQAKSGSEETVANPEYAVWQVALSMCPLHKPRWVGSLTPAIKSPFANELLSALKAPIHLLYRESIYNDCIDFISIPTVSHDFSINFRTKTRGRPYDDWPDTPMLPPASPQHSGWLCQLSRSTAQWALSRACQHSTTTNTISSSPANSTDVQSQEWMEICVCVVFTDPGIDDLGLTWTSSIEKCKIDWKDAHFSRTCVLKGL